MSYKFNSQIRDRGSFSNDFDTKVIKNETMFFNSDLNYAYEHGGPITRNFIENLPWDWHSCNPVFDSRVHMLMPGWFSCIGGYHHDDIPRSTASGQPNYDNPEYLSEHLMGFVNGDISPTLFALGTHELPEVKDDIVYRVWNPLVEEQVSAGLLKTYEVESGKLIEFDWQSMHRGQATRSNGWRWFGRLSRNTDRQNTMTNEIRRQSQVYLDPTIGW
jgi:hypothetical protein